MTAEREGLADLMRVLAEHEDIGGILSESRGYQKYACACGEASNDFLWHRAHLADALADLLAARDRRVRAEALREAADNLTGRTAWAEGPKVAAAWLRDFADRIEAP